MDESAAVQRAGAYLRGDDARAQVQFATRHIGADQVADRLAHEGGLPWTARWLLPVEETPHRTLIALRGPVTALWADGRMVGAIAASGQCAVCDTDGRVAVEGHGRATVDGRHLLAAADRTGLRLPAAARPPAAEALRPQSGGCGLDIDGTRHVQAVSISLAHCTRMSTALMWVTAARRTRVWPRWVGFALTLAAVTVAFVLLRRSLPDPGTVLRSLVDAQWWWLAVALLVQAGSVLMYAVQQRRLLAAYGGAMSRVKAVGVSLARTALSTAMPAGGPVSTAFAVRQFRAHGLSGAHALATTALASAQASAAIVLVYLAWWLTGLSTGELVRAAAAAALLCPAVLLVRRVRLGRRPVWRRTVRGPAGGPARPAGPLHRGAHAVLRLGADTSRACWSLPGRYWLTAGGAAVARRLFDLACFVAAAHAFRLDTATSALVGAYLTGQLIRQIPLVAGGAGLVEAGLLAALITSGAEPATATAAVLTYRLLSCWLIALAGLPVVIALGATDQPGR
ncbi:YbhN family protein [Dactylosporangium cerinum]|uniref:YbhN family protein n=1 Tax=Dactylosporangium cerinum TaxID=1434730 RepID=A0ABV9W041_9ACTN